MKCIICDQESEFKKEFMVRGYEYIRCNKCGLVFLKNFFLDTEIMDFYKKEYAHNKKNTKRIKLNFNFLFKRINRILQKRDSLLEIGSGLGYFLKFCYDKGWKNCVGIEISNSAVEYAKRFLGINLIQGNFDELFYTFPKQHFNLIVMFHVLEHLISPDETLKKIRYILNSEGVLVITVPNYSSFVAKVLKEAWGWSSPPEHIYMFTPNALIRLLNKTGFSILDMYTQCGDAKNNLFELTKGTVKKLFRINLIQRDEYERYNCFDKKAVRPRVYESLYLYRLFELMTDIIDKMLFYPFEKLLDISLLQPELVILAKINNKL